MPELTELKVADDARLHWLPDGVHLRWVPGYEGRYAVTDTGRVVSFAYNGGVKELSPSTDRKGYKRVGLYDENSNRTFIQIHRLVLFAFEGEPDEGEEARHLDGDPTNNRRENLAWGTISENREDARRHGTLNTGEKNGGAKISESDVVEIRERYAEGGIKQQSLADEFGISRVQVTRICAGDRWVDAPGPTA